MRAKTAQQIAAEISEIIDTIPEGKRNTWNFLVRVNDIVSHYTDVNCLMHMNFYNGNMVQSMCVITDGKPGLLVLQSDDGSLPYMRMVDPEATADFLQKIDPIIFPEYPPAPTLE